MIGEPAEAARLREAFAATSPEDAPRAECPPAEVLWEGVRGELSAARLRALLRHIAGCPVCTEAWRLADRLESSFLEESSQTAAVAASARRPSRVLWARSLAAAAVLVLAAGVAFWQGPFLDRTGFRSGPGEAAFELLVGGETLPRAGVVLRWTDLGDATYDVEISAADRDATVLDRRRGLASPEYPVPSRTLAELPPGVPLLVRVRAFRDGEPLAELLEEVAIR